ncbi:uncharacterized protein TNCT_463261, partial [Trichonephila clavata]
KPNAASKIPVKPKAEEKSTKDFQKDNEATVEKIRCTRRMRSKIGESFVSESHLKCERFKAVSFSSDVTVSSKLLESFASIHLDEIKTNDEKDIANTELPPKYSAHSGLVFSMNNPKKAPLRPFNFHEKTNNMGSEISSRSINVSKTEESVSKNKAQYSHSLYTCHLRNRNKENYITVETPHTDANCDKKIEKTHSLYASHIRNRNKENVSNLKTPRTDTGCDKKSFKFY